MNKQELWVIYVSRNSSFEGEGHVTLSKNGLKKLFEQTWDKAYQEGLKDGSRGNSSRPTPMPDVFKDIFGGFNK